MCCTTCWTPTGTICKAAPAVRGSCSRKGGRERGCAYPGPHRILYHRSADGTGCPRFFDPVLFTQWRRTAVKDFFETWKFRILIAIAVFLAGLLLYAAANGRLTAAPQELLSVAVAPFQKAAAWVAGGGVLGVGQVHQHRRDHGGKRGPAGRKRRAAPPTGGLRPAESRERGLPQPGRHPGGPPRDELCLRLCHRAGRHGRLRGLYPGPGHRPRGGAGRHRHRRRGPAPGHRHRGRPDQLPGADHPAPQLQRGGGWSPAPGTTASSPGTRPTPPGASASLPTSPASRWPRWGMRSSPPGWAASTRPTSWWGGSSASSRRPAALRSSR